MGGVPVILAGRESQIGLLRHSVEAVRRGGGTVITVNGSAGSGKTALLNYFGDECRAPGVSFSMVAGAAGDVERPGALLDRLLTALGGEGAVRDGDAAELTKLLKRRLRMATGGRPLVIAVDDVHLADGESIQALGVLMSLAGTARVVLVLTERLSTRPELASLHQVALRLPRSRQLHLDLLGPAGVADLLADRLGAPPGADVVRICTVLTGGNPRLLHALIDDEQATDLPGGSWEPGRTFRRAVLALVERYHPMVRTVAQAYAVFGDSATVGLIGDFLRIDMSAVRRATADLIDAGLLLPAQGFRHDAVRHTLLADIPARDLPRLRSRAIALLASDGTVTREPDRDETALLAESDAARVRLLRDAARRSLAAGDSNKSVYHLGSAFIYSTGEHERAGIFADLARAQWQTDPALAAQYLPYLAEAVHGGVLTGEDALVPVKLSLWQGDLARVRMLLPAVGQPAGPEHAGLRLWLSMLAPLNDAETPPARIARATHLLSSACGTRSDPAWGPYDLLRHCDAADPLLAAGLALLLGLRSGPAAPPPGWAEALLAKRRVQRLPLRRATIGLIEAADAVRRRDAASAWWRVRDVLDELPLASWGLAAAVPLAVAFRAAAAIGERHPMLEQPAPVLPAGSENTLFAVLCRQAAEGYRLGHGEQMTHAAFVTVNRHGSGGPYGGNVAYRSRRLTDPRLRVLTCSELRVAEMAASGSTNRQIATALSITASTVEQHLTKIYRKLSVHGRIELSEVLIKSL